MKSIIRKYLRYTFGLVPYEHVDEMLSRWLRMHKRWEEDRAELVQSIANMSEILQLTANALEHSNKRVSELTLKLAIVDVAPIEAMSRALDCIRDIQSAEKFSDMSKLIVRCKGELERGLYAKKVKESH